MTYLGALLGQVFASLLRNKLRSLLTMGGIAWGTASIVLIVAMGDGFREGQRNNMKSLGENIVILFGGRTTKQAGGQRSGRRIRPRYQDVEDIRKECYLVRAVSGELENNVRAVSEFNSGGFDTSGVEADYPSLRTLPLAQGGFFTQRDVDLHNRVAVIGYKVKKQLFGPRADIVGREILLNSIPFRIVGLLKDKNQTNNLQLMS